ncbi:T6SS effector amidase Tae4 family protein [Inhella sp.]|uniref:T6SS effector amidase Tae4 family protein n=1 Tax=Inhella sp. TaxID=1921806 RepID=UPI0035B01F8A
MMSIRFDSLWDHHPVSGGKPRLFPTSVYENQCAINVSAALIGAGLSLRGFPGAKSGKPADKVRYALRAEELANWLAGNPGGLPFGVRRYRADEIFDKRRKKYLLQLPEFRRDRGIVFFKDYWNRSVADRSGDHIDLFDGDGMTGGGSYLRLQWGVSSETLGWSDYYRSAQIWFWSVP